MSGSLLHAENSPGWGKWWLPTVRSVHGPQMDSLFYWIFWITTIAFVAVEGTLLVFLIKYRSRPERKKAFFTHGNTRLEMAWTLAPAVILALLALFSKKAWDNYRYSPSADDPNRVQILMIGQQFKCNVIYPGPDGKLGKYLLYPKPTDAKWPIGADGKDVMFQNVPGPASLGYDEAVKAIDSYIDSVNPEGKDYSDPAGKDDNYEEALGRKLFIPVNRPIEVQVSSKDVIHDFFLPNFRVKLDAVPGMRGHVYFTATTTSAQRRKENGVHTVKLDDLMTFIRSGGDWVISIDENAPGTDENKNKDKTGWRYVNPAKKKASLVRDGSPMDPAGAADLVEKLKAAGVTEINLADSGAWELVCEELCGQGHNTMTAPLIVLSQQEYDAKNFDKPAMPQTAPMASAMK
ncbi:MAG TPA: cytochrome c oxidase subunit II [Tepidisphaeraceae bacterium]|nr:cytochrome c oxidase subunit II [Tepidisphaeraceae bacterium]